LLSLNKVSKINPPLKIFQQREIELRNQLILSASPFLRPGAIGRVIIILRLALF
jgi:hypothetical protein